MAKPDAERELAAILKNKGEQLPPFLKKPLAAAAVGADALAEAAKPPVTPAANFPDEVRSGEPTDAAVQTARAQKRRETVEELSRADGPLDEILAKRPRDLTEAEAKTAMRARMALPPEQRGLAAFERTFYDNAHGAGPARLDATEPLLAA